MAATRSSKSRGKAPERARAAARTAKPASASPVHVQASSDAHAGADGAYFTVNGRRWRATDPNLPAAFREALTRELMSARRAVKQTKGIDAVAERAARDRVQDAKVALGERGPKWWLPMTEEQHEARIAATIRALARERGAAKSLCPSEVARALGGPEWRKLMVTVRAVAFELQTAGDVRVTQKARVVNATARGAVRVQIVT